MLILTVVLLAQALSVSVAALQCPYREFTCPCGKTDSLFKICIERHDTVDNMCKRFQFCETCRSGLNQCLTCAEGTSGPDCSKGYTTHNMPFLNGVSINGKKLRRHERGTSCPNLLAPKLGSLRCFSSDGTRECTARCLPGHFLKDYDSEEIVLVCQNNNRWSPLSSFPACTSAGLCDLEMAGGGSYNCTTGAQGTYCDVRCSGNPRVNARYYCYPGNPWNPSLPHCVRRKGPQVPSPRECPCQNGGNCDRDFETCRCPSNFQGRLCEIPAYVVKRFCQDPGQIQNGDRLNPDGSLDSRSQSFEEGTSVTYSCKSGFALVGTSLLNCQSSGSWSSQPPVCRRIPVTTVPPACRCQNGGTCERASGNCRCPANYQGLYCENTVVRKSMCRDPGQIENGDRLDTDGKVSSQSQQFEEGSSVVYSCKSGYALEGSSFLTCQASVSWSSQTPVCNIIRTTTTTTEKPVEKISCADPGQVRNGNRMNADGSAASRMQRFEEGKAIIFSCQSGFGLTGSSFLTCLATGSWSSSLPICTRTVAATTATTTTTTTEKPDDIVYCNDPGIPLNAERVVFPFLNPKILTEKDKENFPQGVRIEFTCKDGYTLQGENSIICYYTGEWSAPTPTCLQTERSGGLVYCEDPGIIANGRRDIVSTLQERKKSGSLNEDPNEFPEGTQLMFSCEEGLVLEGRDVLTCQSTGAWTSTLPSCETECGHSWVHESRRISHGTETRSGEWPWQVAMANSRRNRTDVFCGAVLITPRAAVTAAHCVSPRRIEQTLLYFGKYHLSTAKDDSEVFSRRPTSFIVHPNYNAQTLDNDVAVIRFAPNIKYTERIQPVCLPTIKTTRDNLVRGNKGWVTGWGLTEKSVQPDVLLMASVPVVPNRECIEAYKEQGLDIIITNNMFCAGFEKGRIDSCTGDSGGPVVFLKKGGTTYVLEGIVSFGVTGGCGQPKRYTMYAKVGNYVKWIRNNS